MVYGTQEFAQLLKDIIESNKRHPLYNETIKHAEAMSVHIYGDKPMYLLDRARPREEAEVKAYRIENYEPTTKAGADKAIDIVSKVFNPTLYSIRWKDETTEVKELKKYTFDYFPNYNSLISYNKEVVLRKMLADPNALMAIKPGTIPENEADRPEPEVLVYSSCNVWFYDRDHYLIYHHTEERDSKKYYYFDYYDKNQFIHFQANYDPSNRVVETYIQTLYRHGFGEIPAWLLRGKSKAVGNGDIWYESFFSPALGHWNLAVVHESDLLGAYINHMHPQKYELAEECNYQFKWEGQLFPCRGGHITYPGGREGSKSEIECPHCRGTGYHAVKSPYGTYQFNKQKLSEGEPLGLTPVGYITIPVEATKLLEERTEKMNKKAMWALNMDVEDSVGEVQSGAAKVIDRSGQQDTIFSIGSVIFDVHLPNQFYFINKYMFGEESQALNRDENKNLPDINKPTVIDILTVSDLVNNFKVAKESGLDKNFMRLKQIEIVNRDQSLIPEVKAYLITIHELDPLFGYSQDEIDLGVSKGVIRKIDWCIHDNLKSFVDKAIDENKNFLTEEKKNKIAILEKYANEMINSEKPRVDESMLLKFEQNQDAA